MIKLSLTSGRLTPRCNQSVSSANFLVCIPRYNNIKKEDSSCSVIVRVSVVLKRTVVGDFSFQNYTHPDGHTTRTTDTPGFKPFTLKRKILDIFKCG